MELYSLSAHELIGKINNKETDASGIISSLCKRIGQTEKKVKAYVRLSQTSLPGIKHTLTNQETVLKGIPVSIKDNICTQGYNTECCSKILGGFSPPYDATVISRLKKAGASILPLKTNMDEFAFGSSTENSFFGPTSNPWNLAFVPGGSSGGSAAAIASDTAILSLGSDTGGSIRQPASFCSVVGLKPTYGRVSRYGLIAFASSLDQIGPITKDVQDSALLMNVIAGYDPLDSTSVNVPVPNYAGFLNGDVKGLKVGIPREYFIPGMQPEVEQAVRAAIRLLEKNGIRLEEISLPHTEYAVAVYYIIATAEASSNLARYDGMKYGFRAPARDLTETYMKSREQGFGPEVKRRIMLGSYALSAGYYEAYYLKAQKVRALIKKDFEEAFKKCDAIVTPTAPTTAFKIGEKTEDPLQMYLSDIFTISVNLAGLPGLSLPCGFDSEGLPIGMQIIGKHFDEATILRIGHAYEQATEWHKGKPNL